MAVTEAAAAEVLDLAMVVVFFAVADVIEINAGGLLF